MLLEDYAVPKSLSDNQSMHKWPHLTYMAHTECVEFWMELLLVDIMPTFYDKTLIFYNKSGLVIHILHLNSWLYLIDVNM